METENEEGISGVDVDKMNDYSGERVRKQKYKNILEEIKHKMRISESTADGGSVTVHIPGGFIRRHSHNVADTNSSLATTTALSAMNQAQPIRALFASGMDDIDTGRCGTMDAMNLWLNQPSVMEALHVTKSHSGQNYLRTFGDARPLYASLMNRYRILIYSGDVDACVPYVGSQQWTSGLGFPVVRDWHPWSAPPDTIHRSHKAGYAITYSTFQFITINGAGHLVPLTQPEYALVMFGKFLNNSAF